MAEKEQLSLADLGLEKEATPAEKVVKDTIQNNGVTVKQAVVTNMDNVEQVVTSSSARKPVSYAPVHNQGRRQAEDLSQARVITDVNEIAKIKYDPTDKFVKNVNKNRQDLLELADKGIERTMKEMTAPDGRITQAKHEYVRTKYEELINRSKKSKQLAGKIKALQDMMDSDARFDDCNDYEKHGYILWNIAHDDTVETNDDYFGIKANKETKQQRAIRNSRDAKLELDKMNEEPIDDVYNDDQTVVLSSNEPVLPFKDTTKKKKEEKKEKDTSLTLEEPNNLDSDLILDDEEDKVEETKEEATSTSTLKEEKPELELEEEEDSDDDFQLSDDEHKKILHNYKEQLEDNLGINRITDLEGFTISNKGIKLNNALQGGTYKKTSTWGLQFAGQAIEMTPLSGEELMTLSPQQTAYDTVAGLRSVFSVIYRHIADSKKPDFETWLKQVSDYDVDSLLFAVYVANFKDTNILTYQCPNKKCQNVFIKKLDVMDMLKFPNDEVKESFLKVLSKDTQGTNLFRAKPVAINNKYAFGFVTQSVYSSLFEPAALSEEFSKKFKPIIDIMPNIDTIYKIDQENRTLLPITFGEADTFQKTVMRKVKGISAIMKNFTPDERALVVSEAGKISLTFSGDKIGYVVPENTCPVCGEHIDETDTTPLDLLFMRAQLPIIAASIQE